MPPTKKTLAANRACLAKELGVSVERLKRARSVCASRAAMRRLKKSGKKSTKRRRKATRSPKKRSKKRSRVSKTKIIKPILAYPEKMPPRYRASLGK